MEGNDRQAKTASDRSKITARKRKRYEEFQQPTILSLPTELVMEIVARVGASSLRDLFEVKLSCKSLYAIAEDSYVFEKVSVEELPKLQMSRRSKEQSSSFYRRCIECGNSEALYREGVV
ncbi:F-box protein At2g35280-like [Carica papaya]|uniref:F-box protein At2g35280-like n=1 Tax=Carica papaya TaxID=3649 RepID=UPI000B8CCC0C|nr:F-box protein At2g35280-like [Carica papaya]